MTPSRTLWTSILALTAGMACAFVQERLVPSTQPPLPSAVPPTGESTIEPPAPISCTGEACLQACLGRLENVLQTRPFDPLGSSVYEEQGAEFVLVVYRVEGDEIKDPILMHVPSEYHKYQEDTAAHRRIWEFYVKLIPPELRAFLTEFLIFTDGAEGDLSAWVRPHAGREGSWQVGVDLLDSAYPPYLADILVHETAHLLTLNDSQLPPQEDYYPYDAEQGRFLFCEHYAGGGSCSFPESYINRFYEAFWQDSYAEWNQIHTEAEGTATFDEYLQIMQGFYNRHPDWFVSSYAATAIEEDMAETFVSFVLESPSSGRSLREQKVAFYYGFPELVDYRQQIIEGLCAFIR